LLRGLIDEARIIPVEEEYRIELKGELAGILALAQGVQKFGDSATQRALQIKMVAGACNIQCSHRVPAPFKLVA